MSDQSTSCPVCRSGTSRVKDSRPSGTHHGMWARRRECANGHRFTTMEMNEARFNALFATARDYEDRLALLRETYRRMLRELLNNGAPE